MYREAHQFCSTPTLQAIQRAFIITDFRQWFLFFDFAFFNQSCFFFAIFSSNTLAGSSLGSWGTSLPMTASCRMVCLSWSMLCSVVNRVSKWLAMRCHASSNSSCDWRRGECGEQGFDQGLVGCVAVGLLLFQLVAQRHQFIDFGDDAVLFGEWWKLELVIVA